MMCDQFWKNNSIDVIYSEWSKLTSLDYDCYYNMKALANKASFGLCPGLHNMFNLILYCIKFDTEYHYFFQKNNKYI